jgi:hypothetical protein
VKHLFLGSTIISGLILFGTPAFSQDRDRDEDRYHREDRGEGYWAGHLFDRVRADIDHIQAMTPVFSTDEFRLARAKQELSELQRSAAAGKFDGDRDLDDVISALQRVVSDNRMPARDRDLLSDDLNRLREFKEHHERYYQRG